MWSYGQGAERICEATPFLLEQARPRCVVRGDLQRFRHQLAPTQRRSFSKAMALPASPHVFPRGTRGRTPSPETTGEEDEATRDVAAAAREYADAGA